MKQKEVLAAVNISINESSKSAAVSNGNTPGSKSRNSTISGKYDVTYIS